MLKTIFFLRVIIFAEKYFAKKSAKIKPPQKCQLLQYVLVELSTSLRGSQQEIDPCTANVGEVADFLRTRHDLNRQLSQVIFLPSRYFTLDVGMVPSLFTIRFLSSC